MTDTLFFTKIRKVLRQILSKPVTLIKGPQRQQPSIASDLTARKISSYGSVAVEGKRQLSYITRCQLWVLRKRMLGSAKTQCLSIFQSTFSFLATKIVHNPS
jgi:hypothetical protein